MKSKAGLIPLTHTVLLSTAAVSRMLISVQGMCNISWEITGSNLVYHRHLFIQTALNVYPE